MMSKKQTNSLPHHTSVTPKGRDVLKATTWMDLTFSHIFSREGEWGWGVGVLNPLSYTAPLFSHFLKRIYIIAFVSVSVCTVHYLPFS